MPDLPKRPGLSVILGRSGRGADGPSARTQVFVNIVLPDGRGDAFGRFPRFSFSLLGFARTGCPRSGRLLAFHAVVPNLEQFAGRRDREGTHQAEPEKLGVGEIPDALGQLRVLLFPGGL